VLAHTFLSTGATFFSTVSEKKRGAKRNLQCTSGTLTEPSDFEIYCISPAAKGLSAIEHQIDDVRAMSKPRTALFQEGEIDEPMTSQDIFDAQDTCENISKPRAALFK
jgi:hypothetical protein